MSAALRSRGARVVEALRDYTYLRQVEAGRRVADACRVRTGGPRFLSHRPEFRQSTRHVSRSFPAVSHGVRRLGCVDGRGRNLRSRLPPVERRESALPTSRSRSHGSWRGWRFRTRELPHTMTEQAGNSSSHARRLSRLCNARGGGSSEPVGGRRNRASESRASGPDARRHLGPDGPRPEGKRQAASEPLQGSHPAPLALSWCHCCSPIDSDGSATVCGREFSRRSSRKKPEGKSSDREPADPRRLGSSSLLFFRARARVCWTAQPIDFKCVSGEIPARHRPSTRAGGTHATRGRILRDTAPRRSFPARLRRLRRAGTATRATSGEPKETCLSS
jgi:hypothetical protein